MSSSFSPIIAINPSIGTESPSLTPIVMVSIPNQFSTGLSVILEPTTLQAILSEAKRIVRM